MHKRNWHIRRYYLGGKIHKINMFFQLLNFVHAEYVLLMQQNKIIKKSILCYFYENKCFLPVKSCNFCLKLIKTDAYIHRQSCTTTKKEGWGGVLSTEELIVKAWKQNSVSKIYQKALLRGLGRLINRQQKRFWAPIFF